MNEVGDDDDHDESDIEDNLSAASDTDADTDAVPHKSDNKNNTVEPHRGGVQEIQAKSSAPRSIVDVNAWRSEAERVAPKLRSSQRRVTSEWRQRVDQATEGARKVDGALSSAQADLAALAR